MILCDSRRIPLADFSIKHIITSPPYNVGIKYDSWFDLMPQDEYWEFTRQWLTEAYRVMAISGRIGINIPNMGNSADTPKGQGLVPILPPMIAMLQEVGFTIREVITWVKTYAENIEEVEKNFIGGGTAWGSWMAASNPFCRSMSEFVIVAHKQEPKLRWKGVSDITRDEFMRLTRNVWLMRTRKDQTHPAGFHPILPYNFMKLFTYVGDTVLDPFSGSGTTYDVGVGIGRKMVAFDISHNYLVDAKSRESGWTQRHLDAQNDYTKKPSNKRNLTKVK